MHEEDTIAGIATAPGEAGIAVIRISGPLAFPIADEMFRCSGPPPSQRPAQTFAYGHIRAVGVSGQPPGHAGSVRSDGSVGPVGQVGPTALESPEPGVVPDLDEVLMLFMRAPRSFTREDVIEIHSHGGRMAVRRILRRILEAGARLAEPGEFTRRAFLNGRIDLIQAEAVLDLIRARSERAAAAAVEQLEGSLSNQFNLLYDRILHSASDLEATLDFPDDELPEAVLPELAERLQTIRAELIALIETWDEGQLLREGVVLVIAGKPNAGKSTLMNALLGSDRAIVSSTPGTTRDTIEEGLVLDGIPLRVVDTAGLRETDCEIEQEGIRRTRRHVASSDLQVLIVDGSEPLDDTDRAHLAELDPARSLVVRNKTDLGLLPAPVELDDFVVVKTCLLREEGLEALRSAIRAKVEGDLDLEARPHAVISERHRELLVSARQALEKALEPILAEDEAQIVIAASLLREALELIGLATGRVYQDELLDTIFSRFCIGK